MLDQAKIGFIGAGNMGRALVKGLILAGASRPEDILVHDVDGPALERIERESGVIVCASPQEAVSEVRAVVLAVKPKDIASALEDIRRELGPETLLVSIAAGVPLSALRAVLGGYPRLVRAMPNTPAQVGLAATAVARGEYATDEDMAVAVRIFESVGRVVEVDESLMDAVTGLSGSGPAYVFVLIDALADAGVMMGLSRPDALELAAQTVRGAAEMVLATGTHPAELKDMVTSPGGTTAAGLRVLEGGALRGLIIETVKAATERSIALGAGSKDRKGRP